MAGERRWLLAVSLALLLVLAGCSGSGSDATGAESAGTVSDASRKTVAAGDSGANSEFQSQSTATSQRALIRTGTVAVEVGDYDAARQNLTRTTRRLGGFVSDTAQQVHTRENRSWTTGKLVLRVPKTNFSTLMSQAKQVGEVQEATTNTKDVTKQLVDIEARLSNLKAQRDRLRTLYEQANDTENVLDVQKRLSEVQTEIEQLQAQRKSLRRKVAYSTLTVRLNEVRPGYESTDDDQSAWYETGLPAAFGSSVHGVVVVAQGLAVGVAYAMPYLLAFGLPLAGAVAFLRRRRAGGSEGSDLPNVPQSPGSDSEAGDED